MRCMLAVSFEDVEMNKYSKSSIVNNIGEKKGAFSDIGEKKGALLSQTHWEMIISDLLCGNSFASTHYRKR